MIDVKIIKKPKNKATTPTVRTPGAAYGDKSVKEAVHASKADMAKMAEKAILAEQAEHAKKADEATRADEVSLESKTLTHFLRNDIPNTAAEVVTFLKGVIAKAVSFFQGIVNKGDINNDGDITNTGNIQNAGDITNAGNIMTKNLTVTGKATFFELEIQKAKAAGGMTVNSAGTFHVDAVKETADGFVCYQRAEQDGVTLRQMCAVNDQMMCCGGLNEASQTNQTNQANQPNQPHQPNQANISNHFYWRLVTEAPTQTVPRNINGEEVECLKIVLSKTDCAKGSDIPKVGDDLVQIGNRDNKERQSVMMSCAYNSFDQDLKPSYWAHYMGVNDYKISKHRYTWFAANGSNVTGNFKVQSAGGGLESIEDYVKGLAGGKDTVVWHVAFSIRSITGKPGETFKLRYGRTEGENTTWYDDDPVYHGFKQLYAVIIDGATGNEQQFMRLGEDYNVADFFTGGSLTVRMMNSYNTGEMLAQDTIYPEAKPGKDAVSYKLIPLAEEAVAYITEDKKKMIYLSLSYNIQKAVGEQVSIVTDLRTEDMTLTAWTNKMETFELEGDEYGLSYSMEYDKMSNDSCVVTLQKGSDIVDQRIVPITFKPKVVFDIDTVNGTITSQIEAANGKINSIERDINATKSTVGNLSKDFTQIKQTSKEISLTVNNGTRPNLLWGSDLNLDGVDTTNKAAIQKHLGVGLNATKVDSTEWFEYLKGGGVRGADAMKFKAMKGKVEFAGLFWEMQYGAARNLQLKPNTVYTLSAWVRTEFDKNAQGYSVFSFEAFKKEKEDSAQRVGKLSFKTASSWFEPINEWTRVSTTFTTEELLYGSVAMWMNGTKPATLYICRPKLEEGDTATPWCEYDGTVEELLAGGFDIKNREFTATSDNFKVQNNKGEQTFLVDKDGHINAKLISAESISAQKIAQPFVEQGSFKMLMSSPSLSWYITKAKNINDGYVLASELNGAVLNIYNYTTGTIKFYSTFAIDETKYKNKTVNVLVEIEPGAMFRAFGVPIKGVEMTTHEGTTTLVALAPLVPMELTSLSGDVRAKYRGSVKGFLTVR